MRFIHDSFRSLEQQESGEIRRLRCLLAREVFSRANNCNTMKRIASTCESGGLTSAMECARRPPALRHTIMIRMQSSRQYRLPVLQDKSTAD
jgi:hypothetical protein